MSMRFDWDESKNRANYRKHGVWFEEAQTVWADSRSIEFFDPNIAKQRIDLFGSDIRPVADYC